MDDADGIDLRPELRFAADRQWHSPIFIPFAFADNDLFACEIDIFDSESAAFEDAQACPVKQIGHKSIDSI